MPSAVPTVKSISKQIDIFEFRGPFKSNYPLKTLNGFIYDIK